jgi:general secretion pathway protein M
MIERARDWWLGRSERERWLLGVMFALLGVMLFWLIVLRPLDAARLRGELRLAAATGEAGRIASATWAMREARRTAPPVLAVPLTAAIEQAAQANGFTFSRLDLQGADRATVAISTAKAPALFTMLGALETQGIITDRLTLRANSDGTLAVEGILRVRGR